MLEGAAARSSSVRTTAGLSLLALGIGYAAAVVGPPVAAIARDFDVSLSTVGALQSALYAATALGPIAAAPLVHRVGPLHAVWIGSLLLAAGSALAAASPVFAGVLAGRVVSGLGIALGLVVGPVAARQLGMTALGLFGAGIPLGTGLALAVGGMLEDADVTWRAGFAIAAALGLVGSPLIRGPLALPVAAAKGALRRFLREAARRLAFWELMLLYVFTNLVPLVISTWLIHYLTAGGNMGPGVAGALGFALFGATTVARVAGARPGRVGQPTLILASTLLAAAALVALALDRSPAVAAPAVVVLGVGFALPYAVMISRSQSLDPEDPAVAMSVVQVLPNAMPVLAIPLMGWALDRGDGDAAFVAFAVYALVTAVANVRWRSSPAARTSASSPGRPAS